MLYTYNEKESYMKRKLEDLTLYEFEMLKSMGFLWEFYPDAPNTFNEIKKEKS